MASAAAVQGGAAASAAAAAAAGEEGEGVLSAGGGGGLPPVAPLPSRSGPEALGKEKATKTGTLHIHIGWAATALAIVALLATGVGVGAYLGHLNVTLVGVGTLSQTLGLYTAIAGLGVFALATLAGVCAQCSNRANTASNNPQELES